MHACNLNNYVATWGNHIGIFNNCGLKVRKYRYYDRSKNALDLEGMVEDLQRAKDGSIVLLHACAHNRKLDVPLGMLPRAPS